MARLKSAISEADIFKEVLSPVMDNLNSETARSLLRMKFSPSARRKIRRLLQISNRGTISAEERLLLEKYVKVGQMVDIIRAKARLHLKTNSGQSS